MDRAIAGALAAALFLAAGCRSEEAETARAEPPPEPACPYPFAHVYPQNAVAEFWLCAEDPEPAAIIPLAHGCRADIRGPLNRRLARIRLFAPKEVVLQVFQSKGSYADPPISPVLSLSGTAAPQGLEVPPEEIARAGLSDGIHSIEWRVHGVRPDEVRTLRSYPAPPRPPEGEPKQKPPPWRDAKPPEETNPTGPTSSP